MSSGSSVLQEVLGSVEKELDNSVFRLRRSGLVESNPENVSKFSDSAIARTMDSTVAVQTKGFGFSFQQARNSVDRLLEIFHGDRRRARSEAAAIALAGFFFFFFFFVFFFFFN